METQTALKIVFQLIEQSMANGQFKKVEQLKIALQAYDKLKEKLEPTNERR